MNSNRFYHFELEYTLSKGNEIVLDIPQSSKIGALQSDAVVA